jgi:hypothetical protein
MQMVTVFTALSPVDADLALARLSAADFHPTLSGGLSGIDNPGFGFSPAGILVQVPEDEADDAREFLAEPGAAPPA